MKKEYDKFYVINVNPDLNRLQIKRNQRLETLKWVRSHGTGLMEGAEAVAENKGSRQNMSLYLAQN